MNHRSKALVTVLFGLGSGWFWFTGRPQVGLLLSLYTVHLAQWQLVWRYVKGFKYEFTTRQLLHMVCLLLPLLWMPWPAGVAESAPFTVTLTAVSSIALLLFLGYKDVRLMFHPDLILITGPGTLREAIHMSALRLVPAVTEEVFYRGYAVSILQPIVGIWSVPLASALFTLAHVVADWTSVPPRRYVDVALLGFFLGAVQVTTGNLWACVLGHAFFNLPSVIHPIYSVRVHARNKIAQT